MNFRLRVLSIAVAGMALLCSCENVAERDFRQDMRDFVIKIAEQSRRAAPEFIVIPQNGQELITENGEPDGPLAMAYAAAIDGQGREDLFYGYVSDNVPTPEVDREYLLAYLDRQEQEGVEVLATDYCETPAFVDDSYARNAAHGFISFAAHRRELDAIPPRPAKPVNENADNITSLAQAKNFLYLINPGQFGSLEEFLGAISATNYDLLIVDAFFEDSILSAQDVARLQVKANGGRRLMIAYMSIGEAEDYRYYWNSEWRVGSPDWIETENANFEGNFKVQYWRPEWQALILDGPNSYLNRIVSAGFDGVYLDLIDAFEFFE